jgi:hypothetical protein
MAKLKYKRLFFWDGYENKWQPLAPRNIFIKRMYNNIFLAAVILGICLAIGIIGYRYGGPMLWIDALHNASMILSGMGPVAEVKTTWGKVFSSFYALFSGIAFITNIGILLAPVVHRFFHRLHVQEKSN